MRIDQDTYKNNVLNFGLKESNQRNRLYEWRWQQFIDIITVDYPEYFLKFYSHRQIRKYHLSQLIRLMNFKMSPKLRAALNYADMESVNTAEFAKIMRKLTNYIRQDSEVGEVMKAALTQPLPLALHQYQ